MTQDTIETAEALLRLADRCETVTGPDRELDALIRCAVFAPPGSVVEQSSINGAWCIYNGFSTRDPSRRRSWDAIGLSQLQRLGEFTASLDAAMSLVPEGYGPLLQPGLAGVWHTKIVRVEQNMTQMLSIAARAYTPALALSAAALRARARVIRSNAND